MGKRKRYDKMMSTLQQWIDRASAPSPYENQISGEMNSITSFLNGKDYRNLPTGVNVDLLPLAEKRRMQSMMRGTNAGSTAAKGSMAQIGAQQRELDDNELTREWGGEYEQKVGGLMDRKDNLLSALQGMHTGRMSAGVQGNQMQLQNFLNRPKGFNFMKLFQMGAQALPSILSASGV